MNILQLYNQILLCKAATWCRRQDAQASFNPQLAPAPLISEGVVSHSNSQNYYYQNNNNHLQLAPHHQWSVVESAGVADELWYLVR